MNHWEIVNKGVYIKADTPMDLWERALHYFEWCDNNPIETKRTLTSGKQAGQVVVNQSTRPYTLKGLCLHCGIDEEYLRDVRNSQDKASGYYIVVSKILYLIYVQNAEHAMIGEFNPIFTAKMLNIDKEEAPPGAIKVEIVQGLPELSDSENSVLEKLEMEKPLFKNDKREND